MNIFKFLNKTFASQGQSVRARLRQIKPREQVYLIVSVVIIAVLAFVFYSAITFITGSIVKSFEVDEAAVQSQIVRFNLEDYEKVLPKLLKK